jgi:hypothetical protein
MAGGDQVVRGGANSSLIDIRERDGALRACGVKRGTMLRKSVLSKVVSSLMAPVRKPLPRGLKGRSRSQAPRVSAAPRPRALATTASIHSAILLIVGVVPGLEQEDLAEPPVECGDDVPDLGFAEQSVAEEFLEHPFQRLPAMAVEAGIQHGIAEGFPRSPEGVVPDGREDFRASVHVEVSDLSRGLADSQPESENAAG